jgi:hypothetical protein
LNSRFASGCQIVQYVAFLLAQSHHRRQDALDADTPGFALGTKSAFAPQNTAPQSPFGGIIGGFHPLPVDEGPQSGTDFEDIVASTPGFAVAQEGTNFQQVFHLGANRLESRLQLGPRQGAIAEMMPEAKEQVETRQQHLPNHLRFAATIHHSLKIAFEMGSTHLGVPADQSRHRHCSDTSR